MFWEKNIVNYHHVNNNQSCHNVTIGGKYTYLQSIYPHTIWIYYNYAIDIDNYAIDILSNRNVSYMYVYKFV